MHGHVGHLVPHHLSKENCVSELFLYFFSHKNYGELSSCHRPPSFTMAPQRRSGAAPSTANTGPKALIFEYSAHQGHRRA